MFRMMISTYQAEGGAIDRKYIEPAFYAILGNMINWLVYNIKRSCDDNNIERKEMSINQINYTIANIVKINNIIPNIIKNINIKNVDGR